MHPDPAVTVDRRAFTGDNTAGESRPMVTFSADLRKPNSLKNANHTCTVLMDRIRFRSPEKHDKRATADCVS